MDYDEIHNPNDANGKWLPGETFTDEANGISVKVTGATSTGYDVTINSSDGANDDTTAPTIVSESLKPFPGQTLVPRTTNVTATFSEEMDETTVATVWITGKSNVELYEVVIWKDSHGVTDLAGNTLDGEGECVCWTFQTGKK